MTSTSSATAWVFTARKPPAADLGARRRNPGYVTIAFNDETGRRGIALGLPTAADEQISEAAGRLIDVATCRALGEEPPPLATTRSTDSPANTWMRRIDENFRLLAKP